MKYKTIITQHNGYETTAFVWDERVEPHSMWDRSSPHRTYYSIRICSRERLRNYGKTNWKILPTGIIQTNYHRKGTI